METSFLPGNTKNKAIFAIKAADLVFDHGSTNAIKMDPIKTMPCGGFIGRGKMKVLSRKL